MPDDRPEVTSFQLRIPKSAVVKLAASLIVTALTAIGGTFLTLRATVREDHESLAALQIRLIAAESRIVSLETQIALMLHPPRVP